MISKKQKRLVEVVPYNADWPEQFKIEAQAIEKALGDNCIEIHHIGSTSVPGLAAKPVLDMVPVVKNLLKVDAANPFMLELGYEAKGEYGILFRRFFQKGGNQRTHHAHVFERGNPDVERHLKFRDWMRTHPEDREKYALLKQSLADQYPDDIMAYCLGKDEFITNIDKKTGFDGLRIVKALTTREWELVRHFRKIYFFDKMDDPYTWNFESHTHLVLYHGADLIGYAHLELWSNARAVIRVMVIDEKKRNHHFGGKFLALCEKWLKSQGYKSTYLESSPQALSFFSKNGYSVMTFDTADGSEGNIKDTALGKVL
ncbi:MAG: GNAT family N-acetyltransferase [Legionella sp.]|nr:GNAT family N-acetyltransferase [Legionella sp.]